MQQSTAAHVISSHPYDMATTVSRPPSKLFELDLTIVSAKHLKNVNWLRGDLKPYVILWVDPERRLATKSDDSGSTRPVWNERFVLPLNLPPPEAVLTLEIFHSKPSETAKPLVGTLRVLLRDLVDSDESNKLRTFELLRPSGRPHGKIRLKLAIRERPVPDYQIAPPSSYYYSPAPNPTPRDYREYSPSAFNYQLPPVPVPAPAQAQAQSPPPTPPPAISPPLPPPPTHSYMYVPYTDQHTSYYPGYYSQPQPQPRLPPPPRPFLERNLSYSMPGPSAPEDYAAYDPKRGGKTGVGAGLGVGAVGGGLGGLTLEERSKYPERKRREKEKVEMEPEAHDDYSDYQAHY